MDNNTKNKFEEKFIELRAAAAVAILALPVFAATGVSEERVTSFVNTLSKTYAGGKVIFELVPMVLLSPHEATLLKRVVSEQISQTADLCYRTFFPGLVEGAEEAGGERLDEVGNACAEAMDIVVKMATTMSQMYDEAKGGTSEIVLPS